MSRPAGTFGPSRITRIVIGLVLLAVFSIPLLSMLEFTLRDGDGYSLVHWQRLFGSVDSPQYAPIWTGLRNSLMLSVVTVAIVLFLVAPTMVLINLKFPGLRRPFEFIALLPLSIPAIVVVVGLSPIYLFIGRNFGTGVWTLAFAYGVIVLPFAYRSIQANLDAIDLKTLTEAARSLGASWPAIMVHVLAPNMRPGLLPSSIISVAVVLGEFTIASLLNRPNLQTGLLLVNRQDAYIATAFSLLALVFAFVLLVTLGRAGAGKNSPFSRK